MARSDKGTERELTKLANKLERLARRAQALALVIRAYDQRDRLKADKKKKKW